MQAQLQKLISFLGRKIIALIFLNSTIGCINFLIEASFVFVLQLFLLNLGLLEKSSTFLPDWLPTSQGFGTMALIVFGIGRSFTFAIKHYASVLVQQEFVHSQRLNLLKLVLYRGNQVPNKEMMAIFGDITAQSGELVRQGAQLIVTVITATMLCAYGLYLAPKEMLLGFGMLAIISYPFKMISSRISKSGKELVNHLTDANDSILKGLKNNYLLKLYSLEDKEVAQGDSVLNRYKETYKKYGKSSAILMSVPSLTGIIVVAILAYLGTQVFGTPGVALVAFFYIFMRFAQAVSECMQMLSYIRLNFDGFKTLYQWSVKQDKSVPSNYSNSPSHEKQIKISARNVEFNYGEKSIFKNVNLDITTGDILLIKGKSGSGKSTLLNVLAGMYKPSEGQIFYNDAAGAPAILLNLLVM